MRTLLIFLKSNGTILITTQTSVEDDFSIEAYLSVNGLTMEEVGVVTDSRVVTHEFTIETTSTSRDNRKTRNR